MTNNVTLPIEEKALLSLRAGDKVFLSGILYTGRDQAHKRLTELIKSGKPLPFDLTGQTIFYVGPSPAPPGFVIGAAGPTTSYRMDSFAPLLMEHGLKGMVGKGPRNKEVCETIVKTKSIYFYSFGGCGALYAQSVKECTPVAFEDLGPEAIYRLVVEDFPAIVAIDSHGGSVYNSD